MKDNEFDPDGIFSITQEEIDNAVFEEMTAEDMTAKANEFWSTAMLNAADRAALDDFATMWAAIHPQHMTIQ